MDAYEMDTEKYYHNGADKMSTIKGEDFPEMQVDFDAKTGAREKFHTRQEARTMWAKLLRSRGYKPTGNRTWVRDGFAAVIVP
jgi:hypothetical protein